MSMTPDVAAMRIAPTLLDSENDVDALIAKVSELAAKMATTRLEMHAPAAATQRAMTNVLAALDKLGEVRGELVFAHSNLMKGYRELKNPERLPPTSRPVPGQDRAGRGRQPNRRMIRSPAMTREFLLVGAFYVVMAGTIASPSGGAIGRNAFLRSCWRCCLACNWASASSIPARYDSVDPGRVAIDALGFAGFFWIALNCRRFWPLLAAALQLLSLSSHFVRALHVGVDPRVYGLMKSAPTFFVLVALLVGTVNYRRRLKRASSGRSCPESITPPAVSSSPKRSRSSRLRPKKG